MKYFLAAIQLLVARHFMSLSHGDAFAQAKGSGRATNHSDQSNSSTLKAPFRLKSGMREFGMWGGVSFNSSVGNYLGVAEVI